MTYIPTPAYIPAPPLSPQARDLSHELETTIQEFRGRSPGLSDEDVRAALSVVEKQHGSLGVGGPRALLVVGLVLGLLLFVALLQLA